MVVVSPDGVMALYFWLCSWFLNHYSHSLCCFLSSIMWECFRPQMHPQKTPPSISSRQVIEILLSPFCLSLAVKKFSEPSCLTMRSLLQKAFYLLPVRKEGCVERPSSLKSQFFGIFPLSLMPVKWSLLKNSKVQGL